MGSRSQPTPFFQRADVGSLSDRRLLVVSYHFPPDPAVGSKRWEKLSAFAVERGWGVDVIMRTTPAMSSSSPALARLSGDIRVFGVRQDAIAAERLEKFVFRALRRAYVTANNGAASSNAVASSRPAGLSARNRSRPIERVGWKLDALEGGCERTGHGWTMRGCARGEADVVDLATVLA